MSTPSQTSYSASKGNVTMTAVWQSGSTWLIRYTNPDVSTSENDGNILLRVGGQQSSHSADDNAGIDYADKTFTATTPTLLVEGQSEDDGFRLSDITVNGSNYVSINITDTGDAGDASTDTHTITVKGMDANHNVLATDSTVLESIYPTFTFVATGFNDDSTHAEDWSGYGIGYSSVGGSSTMQGGYFVPRDTSGETHTHVAGATNKQTHTHDKWGLGAVAMNKAGTILIGGAHSLAVDSGTDELYRGYAQAFKLDGNNWVKHGRRIRQWDFEDGGSHFVRSYYGRAVAMNGAGDIMAVSMYQWQALDGEDQGDVTIYKWDEATSDWVFRQKTTTFHTGDNAWNGICISMDESGDKLFIVAGKNNNQPALERYDWNGSSYQLAHTLDTTGLSRIYGTAGDDNDPGGAIYSTLDANHVIFGCNTKVRIYQWNGSSYVAKGSDLTREDGTGHDKLSIHMTNAKISEDGNFVAFTSNSTVVSYDWNGSTWVARPTIETSVQGPTWENGAKPGHVWFGSGLGMAGKNTLVIGNPQGSPEADAGWNGGDSAARGRVEVYRYDGSAWSLQETLLGRDEAGGKFGNTIVCSRS